MQQRTLKTYKVHFVVAHSLNSLRFNVFNRFSRFCSFCVYYYIYTAQRRKWEFRRSSVRIARAARWTRKCWADEAAAHAASEQTAIIHRATGWDIHKILSTFIIVAGLYNGLRSSLALASCNNSVVVVSFSALDFSPWRRHDKSLFFVCAWCTIYERTIDSD